MLENKKFQKYLSKETGLPIEVFSNLIKRGLNDSEAVIALIEEKNIPKQTIGDIWGGYLGYTYVDPTDSITNKEYIEKIGINFIARNNVLPLYKLGKAVTVAMAEPENPFLQDKIEAQLGEIISVVFCFEFDIENYIFFNQLKKSPWEK